MLDRVWIGVAYMDWGGYTRTHLAIIGDKIWLFIHVSNAWNKGDIVDNAAKGGNAGARHQ